MSDNQPLDIQTSPPPAPPPSSFLRHYQTPLFVALIGGALGVAALLTYLLFFYTPPQKPTLLGDVKLAVKAPEESASGSELSYEVDLENASNAKLTNLNLEIFYPKGFTFLDAAPDAEAEGGRQFRLADLRTGQEHRLVIVGRLSGSLQEIKTLNVKLHYIPENFHSTFVTEAGASTVILAPDLSLELRAPSHLVLGQTVSYELLVRNLARQSFSDILVLLSYPEKFKFKEASPPPKPQAENEWVLDNLRAGSVREIIISGKVFGSGGQESFVQAELFLKDEEGNRVSAGRAFAFTQIRSSPLLISHKILDQQALALSPGQELKYEVTYENIGEVALNNVVIAVVFENPLAFDFSRLLSGSGRLKDGTLVWTSVGVPELSLVRPGSRSRFEFTIAVSGKLVLDLQKNPRVKTRGEFYSKELLEPISGNTLDLKIETQLGLEAKVSFVAGANPPRQGSSTTYRLDLEVTNTVNDVEAAELVAIIPRADTDFLPDSVSPLEERAWLSFSPLPGRLKWQLNKIFAFSGSFHEARKLSFNLMITPITSESLLELNLLKDIQVAALDEFTGNQVWSNKIEKLTPR